MIIARGRIVAAGSIDELKRASGRQHLEVEVVGSDGSWLDGERRPDGARAIRTNGSSCSWNVPSTSIGLLARARAAGEVRRFAYEPPKLSELFMEAVAPGRRRGRSMSRWRSVWLVARREILERGRSRGFILSVFLTTALVMGSFIVPTILFGDDDVTKIGLIEPAPPGLAAAIDGGRIGGAAGGRGRPVPGPGGGPGCPGSR